MRLAEIDLDTFMNAIVKVNKLMENEFTCNNLLDVAKRDMPIIDQLLAEMHKLLHHEEGVVKEKGITAINRDLTILLALREIEKMNLNFVICSIICFLFLSSLAFP